MLNHVLENDSLSWSLWFYLHFTEIALGEYILTMDRKAYRGQNCIYMFCWTK